MAGRRLTRRKAIVATAIAVVLSLSVSTSASAFSDPSPTLVPSPENNLESPAPSPTESIQPETPAESESPIAPDPENQSPDEGFTPLSEKPEPDLVVGQDQESDDPAAIPEEERTAILGPD